MQIKMEDVQAAIKAECDELCMLLCGQNVTDGNAALDPLRFFSNASPDDQIKVRLDDKLTRITRGQESGEDVELDLLRFLVLLRVYKRLTSAPTARPQL